MLLQFPDMRFHSFDFKGNMVETWAVSDQLIIPGAGLAQGLDQFQGDLPKIKECQSCLGRSGSTFILGVSHIDRIRGDDGGRLHS
jgi:hypothetical protein